MLLLLQMNNAWMPSQFNLNTSHNKYMLFSSQYWLFHSHQNQFFSSSTVYFSIWTNDQQCIQIYSWSFYEEAATQKMKKWSVNKVVPALAKYIQTDARIYWTWLLSVERISHRISWMRPTCKSIWFTSSTYTSTLHGITWRIYWKKKPISN